MGWYWAERRGSGVGAGAKKREHSLVLFLSLGRVGHGLGDDLAEEQFEALADDLDGGGGAIHLGEAVLGRDILEFRALGAGDGGEEFSLDEQVPMGGLVGGEMDLAAAHGLVEEPESEQADKVVLRRDAGVGFDRVSIFCVVKVDGHRGGVPAAELVLVIVLERGQEPAAQTAAGGIGTLEQVTRIHDIREEALDDVAGVVATLPGATEERVAGRPISPSEFLAYRPSALGRGWIGGLGAVGAGRQLPDGVDETPLGGAELGVADRWVHGHLRSIPVPLIYARIRRTYLEG